MKKMFHSTFLSGRNSEKGNNVVISRQKKFE